MKTVNFLDALEANRTKRCRRIGDRDKCWFLVGEMHDYDCGVNDILEKWIIEEAPEEIWVVQLITSVHVFSYRESAVNNFPDRPIKKFREVIE